MSSSIIDIRLGDALELIHDVPTGSIDLIKTSPPWPFRQGGPHPDEYVAWFPPYAGEFRRVLKPTGSLVMHIKEPVIAGHRHACVLSLIIALQAMGYHWHDEYAWTKTNQFPRQTRRRLRDGFDRILHFTIGNQFAFYDRQVSVPVDARIQAERRRSTRRNWESPTGARFTLLRDGWEPSSRIVPTNVLRLPSEGRNLGHPCPYPEGLPEFFIKLLTRPGDSVLDPFLGSGTTAVVAKRLGRSCLGFEINPTYFKIARQRIADTAVPDEKSSQTGFKKKRRP
jgi:site-specific DNA-methyltransferase (adenine-specific)